MTDELTVAVGSLTAAMLVGSTLVARNWPAWDRKPLPTPAVRSVYVSLDELLDRDEVEANDFAWCPTERRTRFHAIRRDRSRRCWTCSTEVPAGVAA
ncbi:hypothetical protein [Streptomyces europaeiscabiei]|uniref:hypothetical protein n=1 Tax=Streptomyces europaeiscabiei TaxID=146819 RepID=UPI0029A043D9|nr:hypothetical protein [Streptomyces europaeiscabiei]MDX2766964.1 hypothetical protein [Streptomyces europaeiscabiei]